MRRLEFSCLKTKVQFNSTVKPKLFKMTIIDEQRLVSDDGGGIVGGGGRMPGWGKRLVETQEFLVSKKPAGICSGGNLEREGKSNAGTRTGKMHKLKSDREQVKSESCWFRLNKPIVSQSITKTNHQFDRIRCKL